MKRKQSELERLRDENARLRAANELRLARAEPNPDGTFGFDLVDPTGVAGLIAECFLDYMEEIGAPNYVEFTFLHRKDARRGVLITVQRIDGKSPHALKVEAERERDELRKRLDGHA